MSYCETFEAYKPATCAKWLRLLGRPTSPMPFVCDDADKGAVVKVCQPGGVISMRAANWNDASNMGIPYGPVTYPSTGEVAMVAAGVVGLGLAAYLLFGR